MRRTRRLARFGTGLGLVWLVAALTAAETADELVAKNIQARGGLEEGQRLAHRARDERAHSGEPRRPRPARAGRAHRRWRVPHARWGYPDAA